MKKFTNKTKQYQPRPSDVYNILGFILAKSRQDRAMNQVRHVRQARAHELQEVSDKHLKENKMSEGMFVYSYLSILFI